MPSSSSRKAKRAAKFKQGPEARAEEKAKKVEAAKIESAKVKKAAKEKKRAPPRFLLFIGNLPYQCTEEEVKAHFERANPTAVRMRPDKGIAFLEFVGDTASANMHTAFRFHHSLMRGRKINVELSAGGGGNSSNRLEKIRAKNEALQTELAERIGEEKKMKSERRKQEADQAARQKKFEEDPEAAAAMKSASNNAYIHPSRMGQIQASIAKSK